MPAEQAAGRVELSPSPSRGRSRSLPWPFAAHTAIADLSGVGHTIGEVQLTCDECEARFDRTVLSASSGLAAVSRSGAMGHDAGWTCIVGRDRCPKCSQLAPPQAIGNGAGPHQGDEQHRLARSAAPPHRHSWVANCDSLLRVYTICDMIPCQSTQEDS